MAAANGGGLVGWRRGGAITASYCDTEATKQQAGVKSQFTDAGVTATGYHTADLQRPTGYTGICQNWNLDTDGDSTPDAPWYFGSSGDYPTLRYARSPGGGASDGSGGSAPSQDQPDNPALDHPESYENARYAMAATGEVPPGADGEPASTRIRFDLGNYQGEVFLSLSLWNGDHFASYESHDLAPPPLERDGQTASVRATTDPAHTRFLLDGAPNGLRMNLLLGYADCHTDDAAAEPAEATATAAPMPYVNEQYAMTAACQIQPNAGGEPASSLIRFDLGQYQGDVFLSLSI